MTADPDTATRFDVDAPHSVAGIYRSEQDMAGVYRCRACQRWVGRVFSGRRGWQHADPALNPPRKRRMAAARRIFSR